MCSEVSDLCSNFSHIQDLEKKEAEYKKSENTAHIEYNALCRQLGISSYNTAREELTEKVVELPEIYQKVAAKTKSLDKVVEFYSAFVEFTLGRQYDSNCVSMIKYVIGELPSVINATKIVMLVFRSLE